MDLPNLSNATPGFLADELGRVREELKALKMLEGHYKEALVAAMDGATGVTVEGETFAAFMDTQERACLDTRKAKAYLASHGHLSQHMKTSTATMMRVVRVAKGAG